MRCSLSFFLLLVTTLCFSQQVQVLLPPKPVTLGTAFQVQYICTQPQEIIAASAPLFENFKLISGPNKYNGIIQVNGKPEPIQNITYTLVPLKAGKYKIGPITVTYKNGTQQRSKVVVITIQPPPNASFVARLATTSGIVYKPSTKPALEKLLRENLFVKVFTDKKEVYEGEPVLATFKLFSSLPAESEAVRSPSFYGFSVVDVADTRKAHTAVETLNGKIFNTAILRQVLLYPSQAGRLAIDAMYVHNEVTLHDSLTLDTVRLENEIITAPHTIAVKPLPQPQPHSFSGAVGRFSIKTALLKDTIAINEEGKLVLTLKGSGNFIQLAAPAIKWPQGVETFESYFTDQVAGEIQAGETSRIYTYPFALNDTGLYQLPSVAFSYFDPHDKKYKTISSQPLSFFVTAEPAVVKRPILKKQRVDSFMLAALMLSFMAVLVFVILYLKKKKSPENIIEPVLQTKSTSCSNELAALGQQQQSVQQSCLQLQQLLHRFLKENKTQLLAAQKEKVQLLLNDCQRCLYSKEANAETFAALYQRATALVKEAENDK